MIPKTIQLAENLSLEEYGTEETQLARDLAGRIQQLQNIKKEKLRAAGLEQTKSAKAVTQRMTFNPLHPSMELPPEQLIRLMGMHAQQLAIEARKHKPSNQKTTASDSKHIAPGLLELEYSDEYETSRSYKLLAATILILVCVSGYLIQKYLADKPVAVSPNQAVIEPTLPANEPAPVLKQAAPKPAATTKSDKIVNGGKSLNTGTLPAAVIPAEINAPAGITVINELPTTDSMSVIEDTIEMGSDDLSTEPESGIQPTIGLTEGFPGDETGSTTLTSTTDTTPTADTPETDATNSLDIQATELPTTNPYDSTFPEEDL